MEKYNVTVIFFMAVGGGEDLRIYWADFLRRTHILVYVVDSSDRGRLPLAKDELHRLLMVDAQLPVVILGNKQVSKIQCALFTSPSLRWFPVSVAYVYTE